jgi:3'-phosphoadenosine 5'-phosphosulfate sulfotransferase (PAPS reductase)/FAD synthetase
MKLSLQAINYEKPDLRVLSLGAGVQSSTVLFKMLEGEIPMADVSIFADTGNEPKEVYSYLEYLRKMSDQFIPLHITKKSNIVEDALATKEYGTNKGFLTMPTKAIEIETGKKVLGRRQCTNDYKIQPINKKIRELLGVKTLRGKTVEVVMGISTDEIQRAKQPRNKWQVNYYPLIELDLSRHDCKHYFELKGLKTAPRSACIMCPYHSNEEWLHLKTNYPAEFQEAVDFDNAIRDVKKGYKNYLHNSFIPLEEVNFKDKQKVFQGNLFDDECEGICGV